MVNGKGHEREMGPGEKDQRWGRDRVSHEYNGFGRVEMGWGEGKRQDKEETTNSAVLWIKTGNWWLN